MLFLGFFGKHQVQNFAKLRKKKYSKTSNTTYLCFLGFFLENSVFKSTNISTKPVIIIIHDKMGWDRQNALVGEDVPSINRERVLAVLKVSGKIKAKFIVN